MKRQLLLVLLILLIPMSASARDYLVEFFDEHYKEEPVVGGGELKIYHTLQIKTEFGNKVLVLVGDDAGYRTWLRKYIRDSNKLVVTIPEKGDDKFKHNIAVAVDVQQVHPVWDKKWDCEKCRGGAPPVQVKAAAAPAP